MMGLLITWTSLNQNLVYNIFDLFLLLDGFIFLEFLDDFLGAIT